MSDQARLETETTTPPWRERAEAFETPLVTWLESGEDSAAIARRLIRGHTLLTDEQARVSLVRLAFFAGQQTGVALAQGDEMRWAQADDGRSEPKPERQRDAEHASTLARVLLLLVCIAALPFLGGCAGTLYTFEASVGANVTSSLTGAGYDGGFAGPSDVVQFAVQVQRGRGFCELRHISHISAGPPFNDRFEDFADLLSCGLRIRAGGFR